MEEPLETTNMIQIGDELEICRNGRNEVAMIRYSRPGEFKIQYSVEFYLFKLKQF